MKYLLFWLTLLAILFHFCPAQAADWSIKFGPSIQEDTTNGGSKMFGVRREESLLEGIDYAIEGGGWSESGGKGRSTSAFGKLQLGVKPGPFTGVFGYGFFGPCFITSTDSQLSSFYQFSTDIGVGVRDLDSFMTLGYAHISNAGLKLPNHGRDYLLFSVGLSL